MTPEVFVNLLRIWLQRRKWHSFAVSMKEYQSDSCTLLGATDFYVSAFDLSARSAIEKGTSGLRPLEVIMRNCTKSKQKPGGGDFTAIDLGANVGRYSIFFTSLYSRVIAIEAHPLTFRLLSINTETFPSIRCLNIAVSDSSGGNAEIKEYSPLQSPRASIEPRDGNGFPVRSFKVPRKTLDSLLQQDQAKIGLIKVDVEGHDLHALFGAKNTIKRFKPDIVFEYNTASPELLQALSNFGYNKFFAPNTEILAQFKGRIAMLKWCLSRSHPVQDFKKLYSKDEFFEFIASELPLSELVLALPSTNAEN